MQIIKDKKLTENTWQYLADDAQLTSGNMSVSLTKWLQAEQQLLNCEGQLGVRICPHDSVTLLANQLDKIALVELDFPDFADGRLFSSAWLLRSRYHYEGEIRAVGHFMPDQVFYLSRVGVNAFAPEKEEYLPFILANLNDFSVAYQNSIN